MVSLRGIEVAICREDFDDNDFGRAGYVKVWTVSLPRDYKGRVDFNRTFMGSGRAVAEAIATTTSGAAMAVYGARPSLVLPTSLIANLDDTTINVTIPQGSSRARWLTITHLPFTSLTQNTEPAQASQTLTTQDCASLPYGTEQQISFEVFKKVIGIFAAEVKAAQLGALIQKDALILNAADAATGIAATIFGNGRANEASIIATDTMTNAMLLDAKSDIETQGYTADDLIWVGSPSQFDSLVKDSNLTKPVSYLDQEALSYGIAWIDGIECRRSTQVPTGTGSAAITTHHSFLYKKEYTLGTGSSAELTVEWYRDVRANSIWLKAHLDMAAQTLAPLSLVKIITA